MENRNTILIHFQVELADGTPSGARRLRWLDECDVMAKKTVDTDNRAAAQTGPLAKLLTQYGCGPVKFTGADEALYERHLLFDSVTDIKAADARDRFEAIARSVRDVLSQRWIRTEQTYKQQES